MQTLAKPKKRLLLLLAAVFCIVGLLAGGYGYRRIKLHRDQQALKLEGLAAFRAGQPARAVELLSRYLHAHADDIDALRAYAESRQAASDPNDLQATIDTIAVLKSLSQLSPLRENEQRRLLQLYARSGNDALAARQAALLLAAHPADVEAMRYKAYALLRQGDFAAAAEAARQWGRAAPDTLDAECLELAAMQQSRATPRDILSRAATLRRDHPNEPRFELLESIALTLTNQDCEPPELASPGHPPDTRTAADWARQAAAHAPADATYTRTLVDQLNRLALFDDSLAALQIAAARGNPDSRHALARRLWESNQWRPLAQLLQGEPTTRADPELLFLYGTALVRLDGQVRQSQSGSQVWQIQTDLAARGNDPLAKAWLLLLRRFSSGADPGPRQQMDCFEAALQRDSNNPYLQYFCAEALERLGETDMAIGHLEAASSLGAAWAAAPARLAGMLLGKSRVDAALHAADQATAREFRNGQIHDLPVAVVLCRVWLAALTTGRSHDSAGLSQLIDAVQKASPGENETMAIRIALLVRAKDRAGAAKMLSDVIEGTNPLSESALLSYAALSQSAGLGLESACLDRCQREHGMTPDMAFARAGAAMAAGGPAKGLQRFDSEYALHHDPANAAMELTWQVARAHFLDAVADPGARTAWIALGDSQPDALGIQQMTLAAPAARSDREFIDRTIERLRKLTGEGGVQWRLARAHWLLEPPGANRNDVEAATRILGAIIRACPQCADARLALASSLQRLQQPAAAVEQLQAVVAMTPDSLQATLQLVGLLGARGDFARAEPLLRRFTDGPLASPDALASMGWAQEHEGDLDGAEHSYRHALSLRPELVAAQNNLAMLLLKKGQDGDIKEALALAEQAARVCPNSAPICDTLAAAQAANGDPNSAMTSIAHAIALDGCNDYKVHQIELLVQIGRKDAARSALAQLESASGASTDAARDWEIISRIRKLREKLAISTTSVSAK